MLADVTLPGGFARHGGRLSVAQSVFPHAPQPWIDLSTGINPKPYPAPRATSAARNRLPDVRELARLEAVAAESFGVADTARVVAVGGTECALRLLPVVLGLREVVIAAPTYGSHEDAWRRVLAPCSGAVRTVATGELNSSLAPGNAVIVVNPNNPDGRVFSREQLLALHSSVAVHGGKLIVDESFGEVAPHANVAHLAGSPDAPDMIVLRSFGKFYGLAGVRLGFVIAAPPTLDTLRGLLGDWPVSSDALVAGLAAYADRAWADTTRTKLQAAAARLDELLKRAGFEIAGGTSLYRLARAADAPNRFTRLAAHGILARPFAYDATLLRFGLPAGPSEWQRVANALGANT
jgi:cobalamin biosynthesis protein CobC